MTGRRFFASLLMASIAVTALLADEQSDIGTIKGRLLATWLPMGSRKVDSILKSQEADGSWKDIDYQDQSRAIWKPAAHFDRLVLLAAAWRNPANALYGSPQVLEALHKGIDAWFVRNLKASNWWFNTIGIPQAAMKVLILADAQLAPEDRDRLVSLLPDPDHVPKAVATGQNLVWHASEQLVRGLMKPDVSDIKAASLFLQADIKIGEGEGIQPDGSFHQHGYQLYSGGYGLDFIHDASWYASILAGTAWAYSDASLNTLAFYLLEGERKMLRGLWFDDAARGREPSRPHTSTAALALGTDARELAALLPAKSQELLDFASTMDQAEKASKSSDGTLPPPAWLGTKAFWRSDFISHSGAAWYGSVRMVSRRSVGTELVNGENLAGFWQAFGATRILRRGDEYADIYPLWDAARIPGVTSPHRVPPLTKAVSQDPAFVGSVDDGKLGFAVMDVDKEGLVAHKAWFIFDKGILALGSGITGQDPAGIATTVNQTRSRGSLIVDGKSFDDSGEKVLGGIHWALQDGIGYVFDGSETVSVQQGLAGGSWKAINHDQSDKPLSEPLFCLWIDHAGKPDHARYQYWELPGFSEGDLAAWAAAPEVRAIQNEEGLQVVYDVADACWALAFWKADTARLDTDLALRVSRPCLVLLENSGTAWTAFIADPSQGGGSVDMKLSRGKDSWQARVNLPSGSGMEGSTLKVSVDFAQN